MCLTTNDEFKMGSHLIALQPIPPDQVRIRQPRMGNELIQPQTTFSVFNILNFKQLVGLKGRFFTGSSIWIALLYRPSISDRSYGTTTCDRPLALPDLFVRKRKKTKHQSTTKRANYLASSIGVLHYCPIAKNSMAAITLGDCDGDKARAVQFCAIVNLRSRHNFGKIVRYSLHHFIPVILIIRYLARFAKSFYLKNQNIKFLFMSPGELLFPPLSR